MRPDHVKVITLLVRAGHGLVLEGMGNNEHIQVLVELLSGNNDLIDLVNG